jgi:hypothetical protein
MDHIVYVSRATRELDNLIAGGRTMLVRGSFGKKTPYGCVQPGDSLFFATGYGRNMVKAKAEVSSVFDSPKLTGLEPECLLADHADKLLLNDVEMGKWSGKRFFTLIGLRGISPVVPFSIAARGNGENDDWIVVDDIDEIIE